MAVSDDLQNASAASISLYPMEQQVYSVDEKQPGPNPNHPIAQLQGPFEESIFETHEGSANEWVVDIDAQSRRRDLLENDEYERLCGRKWRQRSSER